MNEQSTTNPGQEGALPAEEVGRLLRQSRESYGQDLRVVADALKIRHVYLEAIEKGHHDRLPGTTYAVGFVRSYAEFLGLDGESIANQYRREIDGSRPSDDLYFPTPAPESKLPGTAVFIVGALLAVLAYGGWYYISQKQETVVGEIPAVPEHLEPLVDETASTEEVTPPPTPESLPAAPQAEETVEAASASDPPVENTTQDDQAPETTEDAESDPVPETAPVESVESVPLDEPATDTAATSEEAQAETLAIEEVASETNTPEEVTAEESASEETGPEESAPEETGSEEIAVSELPSPPISATDSEPDAAAAEAETSATTQETTTLAAIPAVPNSSDDSSDEAAPIEEDSSLFGAENTDSRILLSARMDCWVQVKDSEGELLLSRVLRQGERYQVPNREGITLLMGNAGGLDIVVDGVTLKPFGPVGAVRRDVLLEPQALLARSASQ